MFSNISLGKNVLITDVKIVARASYPQCKLCNFLSTNIDDANHKACLCYKYVRCKQ